MNPKRNAGLRLEPATIEKLRVKAAQHGFTMNWLANKAINEMLDNMLDPEDIKWVRGDERSSYIEHDEGGISSA